MTNTKLTRQSGIELLRIYAILSVIILHYFNYSIGGGAKYIQGTISVFVWHLFLTLAFCAVDLFVMISGFFLSMNLKRSFGKIIFLLFEASVLRIILYIVNSLLYSETITAAGIVRAALIYGYFIVFYSIVYLLSPLINIGFNRLDEKNEKKAVILLFVLFSVVPAAAAVLSSYSVLGSDWTGICTITAKGSMEGYSIVNFFLCYVIGGHIRHQKNKCSRKKVLFLFAFNTVALLIWGYINWQSAYTYDNPLVVLEAAFLLVLFKDLKFRSKIINELASSGFTCYLVHRIMLDYIAIEKYASKSWYILLLHLLLSSVAIYCICYVIHKIYCLCTEWFVRLLSPRIDKLNLTICVNDEY